MSNVEKTLVFVPTYNERDNVEPLVFGIRKACPAFDIVVLDDKSPDGTGQILDEMALKEPRLRVIHRRGKEGIGTAHQAGVAWAYAKGYTTLITMDADFTHLPENIMKLVEQGQRFDVVVGSRYMQKNSLEGWNPLRKSLTWTAHVLTTVLLGLSYDSTGAFRLYRLDRIPKSLFSLIQSGGYSFFFESLHLLNFNRFRITEVPIALPPRTYGSSKMKYSDALHSLKLLFSTFLKTIFQRDSIKLSSEEIQIYEGMK